MQTRFAFNAGELMPELSARADLDVVPRGCDKLENWVLSQAGSLRRRPGMKRLSEAIGNADAMLFRYVYSYADVDNVRFLVEVGNAYVCVRRPDGSQAALFRSGKGVPTFSFTYGGVRVKQINALMILTSLDNPPMELRFDGVETWTFKRYAFKHAPWEKNHEAQDNAVTVEKRTAEQGYNYYHVTGDADLPDVRNGDELRVSFWRDEQEAKEKGEDVRAKVTVVEALPEGCTAGSVYAIKGEETERYYAVLQQFERTTYVAGLEDPDSYPDYFQLCEEEAAVSGSWPCWRLSQLMSEYTALAAGGHVKQTRAEWEYWTCIKDFPSTLPREGLSFKDYPAYFRRGVKIGKPLVCRGKWSFYCAPLWYGEYEVLRNFKSRDWTDTEWETRGTSYSRLSEAANIEISGDESDEECYLQLVLRRSRYANSSATEDDKKLKPFFPPDKCGNKLVVEPYKADLELVANVIPWNEQNEVRWISKGLEYDWQGTVLTKDWSLAAFCSVNGYPLLCDVFNQRLVFAATSRQPQTLWLSRTDDLDNFLTGGTDDAAMQLTISTMSQNPICWLMARNKVLLIGTSEAEWVLSSGYQGGGITNINARVEDHSHVGSSNVAALAMEDKILFVSRGSWSVHEFGYSFETDGYLARCLSELAGHIGKDHGGILSCAMLSKPDTVALFVLGDGELACCTYNRIQEVKGWHRWNTNGQVVSVCTLPDGMNADVVYLLVRRDNTLYLECVKEGNAFADGEHEYESSLLTNVLDNFIEKKVGFENRVPFQLWIGAPIDNREEGTILLSNNGKPNSWTVPAKRDDVFEEGWHEMIARATWQGITKAGLRVRGAQRECVLYAIQL